ncbi:hypothetical protein F3Y22_tig00112226pilonHSYRG00043 [Hibiscus syriacus]|uniref:DUF4408 domain-containing protein n=1 Tax=Hibiscus syriacus TaxID=106335 RepID=A0A6A2Y823_HIBSY|nr:hypothetical protein F3Y22_tig00112226pilonHSYRG00043 [Hibiscus syriacus]
MATKKQMKTQFSIPNTLHLLAGISFACSFFCSDIPSICSSMKQSLLISLPCIWSSFSDPKCLFVVVNVIVIFLVGESGVAGSKKPPVARDVYDEYIKRSHGRVTCEGKGLLVNPGFLDLNEAKRMDCKEEKGLLEVKEVITCESELPEKASWEDIAEENEREIVEEETYEIAEEINGREIVEEETYEIAELTNGREIVEDEQVVELPAEELNKRVEDFIARVNKQRWMEIQLPVL